MWNLFPPFLLTLFVKLLWERERERKHKYQLWHSAMGNKVITRWLTVLVAFTIHAFVSFVLHMCGWLVIWCSSLSLRVSAQCFCKLKVEYEDGQNCSISHSHQESQPHTHSLPSNGNTSGSLMTSVHHIINKGIDCLIKHIEV